MNNIKNNSVIDARERIEILEVSDFRPTVDRAIAQEQERRTQALIESLIQQGLIEMPLDSESLSERCRRACLILQIRGLSKELRVYSEPRRPSETRIQAMARQLKDRLKERGV